MSEIDNENFIVIQGWMVNDLKLKGSELLIYAIIYGFSQAENQCYNGSLKYLADWVSLKKPGVIANLNSLIAKGYITKEEKNFGGVQYIEYRSIHLTHNNKGYIDIDKDSNYNNSNIDIKEKKSTRKESISEILEKIENLKLKETYLDFLEMRNKIKSPIVTERALKMLINKLNSLATDQKEQIAILEQSILNNWKSVYPIKTSYNQDKNSYGKFVKSLSNWVNN